MSQSADVGALNLEWSALLVATLVDQGIDRFVISPGSRSTPLALAVARHPATKHWIIIDERSAAFFALGQSRQNGSATALICTSGSAVANWLPAVVEANHAAISLLLLSSDRPPELHGRGANQTIEQQQLFGEQVRGAYSLPPPDEVNDPRDALGEILQQALPPLKKPLPGPVHLNIPFREPLIPQQLETIRWDPTPIPLLPARGLSRRWIRLHQLAAQIHHQPGIILCGEGSYGDNFSQQLISLAEQLDCVILADPLSNLRWGEHDSSRIISHYDGFLRHQAESLHPYWVIQFGDLPISKALATWLKESPPTHHLNIQHQRHWSDPESLTTETIHCSPEQFIETIMKELEQPATLSGWKEQWATQEQQAASWRSDGPMSEQQLLQQLHQQLPANSVLFSANSMMIRDIDGWLPARKAALQLHANRGASGIDGNLSTVCGIRSMTDPDLPVIALLGDLTLFHDLNALSLVKETGGNLTIIVLNNGGGNIFSYLPPAHLPEFESLWLTPPNINFSKAAALYQLDYLRVEKAIDLQQLLNEELHRSAPKLIEWVIDREASNAAHQHYWESLS